MNTRLEEIDLQSAASEYSVQGSTSEQNEWGRVVGYKRGYNDAWDQAEQHISDLEATVKMQREALRLICHRSKEPKHLKLFGYAATLQDCAETAEQALEKK